MKITRIPMTVFMLIMLALSSGCVTGIVSNPDLNSLVYDSEGVLRYNGRRVEGIKLELPWYQEMWPDSPSEWGFTLITAGAAAVVSGGGGGGSNSSGKEIMEEPVAVTTSTSSTSSKTDSGPSETAAPADSGGGGGGGGTAPPSGGGIELPF